MALQIAADASCIPDNWCKNSVLYNLVTDNVTIYSFKILWKKHTLLHSFPTWTSATSPCALKAGILISPYDHPEMLPVQQKQHQILDEPGALSTHISFKLTVLTVKNGNTITGARMTSLSTQLFTSILNFTPFYGYVTIRIERDLTRTYV